MARRQPGKLGWLGNVLDALGAGQKERPKYPEKSMPDNDS
jgi:hypothetical protein